MVILESNVPKNTIESVNIFCEELKIRYYNNKIYYSLSGNFLVYINPHLALTTSFEKDWSPIVSFVDTIKEEDKSSILYFRGCCGSGKTELLTTVLFYLLLSNNNNITNDQKQIILQELSPSLKGSYVNPLKLPSTNVKVVSQSVSYCLQIYSLFGTVATDQNSHASKHIKHIILNYSDTQQLLSVTPSIYMLESIGFMSKSTTKVSSSSSPYIFYLFVSGLNGPIKEPEEFKINDNQRESYLQAASLIYGHDFDLMKEFHYIQGQLLGTGLISAEEWQKVLSVVAACIHLLSVTIVGAEITIISSATKSNISAAESLLGLSVGTITAQLLKKRMETERGEGPAVDCKPSESRALLESLSLILYKRVVEFLLSKCPTVKESDVVRSLHLVDIPGYCLNADDTVVSHSNLTQLISAYTEELFRQQFVKKVFSEELKLYMDEGIDIGDLSVSFPDMHPFCDIFQRPSTGIISLLEDICLLPKIEDKLLADKINQNNSNKSGSSLVKAMSHKAKATSFTICHSFGEIQYDCEGFIVTNRSFHISNQLNKILETSSVEFIRHENENNNFNDTNKNSTSPARKLKTSMTSKFMFNSTKKSIQSLLNEVINLSVSRYAFCLRVNPFLKSEAIPRQRDISSKNVTPVPVGLVGDVTSFDNNYLVKQLEYFNVLELSMLSVKGYPRIKSFVDFYNHFRSVFPLEIANLPIVIDDNNIIEESRRLCISLFKLLQQKLLKQVIYNDKEFRCGLTRVFMRDHLSILLDTAHHQLSTQRRICCLKIQTIFRLFKYQKPFKTLRFYSIIVQKYVRGKKYRLSFLLKKQSVTKLQTIYRMYYRYFTYRKILKAACIIKKYCFHIKKDKIRYNSLRNSLRLFQNTVRCFTIRKNSLDVCKALSLIQNTAKKYVTYKNETCGKLSASLIIQKYFRRFLVRNKSRTFLRLLLLKKEQRLANKVVLIIQSRWRRILVIMRINEIIRYVIVIQRWLKVRKLRFKFIDIINKIIFLQSVFRRKLTIKIVNEKQIESLFRDENQELNHLARNENAIINMIPFMSRLCGSGYCHNGYSSHSKVNRIFISYNIYFDTNFAYPDGWMVVVMKWIIQMKEKENKNIQKISIGNSHTVILDEFGNLYTMGIGDLGQLGHNNRKSFSSPKQIDKLNESTGSSIPKLQTTKIVIKDICCGANHSLLLTSGGKIYSWGDNRRGQLGHSIDKFDSISFPKLIGSDNEAYHQVKNIKLIACGSFHSACVNEAGLIYTWGASDCRGRDDQNPTDCSEPMVVTSLRKKRVRSLVCGESHITVALVGGLVVAWGNNSHGQLGNGSTKSSFLPTRIPIPSSDFSEVEIFCGGRHMLCLTKGEIWQWGWNKYGQIGLGSTENVLSPVKVSVPGISSSSAKQVIKGINLGYKHTVVITADSRVFGWGCISLNIPNKGNDSHFVIKSSLKPTEIVIPTGLLGGQISSLSGSNSSTLSFIAFDVELNDSVNMNNGVIQSTKSTTTVQTDEEIERKLKLTEQLDSSKGKKVSQLFVKTEESRSSKKKAEFSTIGKPLLSPNSMNHIADPAEVKERLRRLIMSSHATAGSGMVAKNTNTINHKSKSKSFRMKSETNNTSKSSVKVIDNDDIVVAVVSEEVKNEDKLDGYEEQQQQEEENQSQVEEEEVVIIPVKKVSSSDKKKVCRFDQFERESFVELFSPLLISSIRQRKSKNDSLQQKSRGGDDSRLVGMYGIEMPISEKVFRNTFNLMSRQDPISKSIARTRSLQQDEDLLLLVNNNNEHRSSSPRYIQLQQQPSFDSLDSSPSPNDKGCDLDDFDTTIDLRHPPSPPLSFTSKINKSNGIIPPSKQKNNNNNNNSSSRSDRSLSDNRAIIQDFSSRRLAHSLYTSPNNNYNSLFRASRHSHKQKLEELSSHLDSAISSLRVDITIDNKK